MSDAEAGRREGAPVQPPAAEQGLQQAQAGAATAPGAVQDNNRASGAAGAAAAGGTAAPPPPATEVSCWGRRLECKGVLDNRARQPEGGWRQCTHVSIITSVALPKQSPSSATGEAGGPSPPNETTDEAAAEGESDEGGEEPESDGGPDGSGPEGKGAPLQTEQQRCSGLHCRACRQPASMAPLQCQPTNPSPPPPAARHPPLPCARPPRQTRLRAVDAPGRGGLFWRAAPAGGAEARKVPARDHGPRALQRLLAGGRAGGW